MLIETAETLLPSEISCDTSEAAAGEAILQEVAEAADCADAETSTVQMRSIVQKLLKSTTK
jgi:hypothetical protein